MEEDIIRLTTQELQQIKESSDQRRFQCNNIIDLSKLLIEALREFTVLEPISTERVATFSFTNGQIQQINGEINEPERYQVDNPVDYNEFIFSTLYVDNDIPTNIIFRTRTLNYLVECKTSTGDYVCTCYDFNLMNFINLKDEKTNFVREKTAPDGALTPEI